MYPDRRPYATAVNHSGYLAKPLLPPVEALRILNSAVGMDVPCALRCESLAVAGSSHGRPHTAGRSGDSRGVQLFKPATLESAMPFAFKEKDYHNSQQVALNAQLSNALEELFKVWHRKVTDLNNYLSAYPPQSATSNKLTEDAMWNFFQGYRSMDVLPVTMEQLARDFKLMSTPEMLNAIQNAPALPGERIRRTLDALLNSTHFLAPLDNYVQDLEPLASVALPDEPKEGADGEAQGPVWLSKAAVSMHEKFFYNPSEYALKELRKSDAPLERLERRVLEKKKQKEHAIDEEQPGEALNFLTTQVDLSNDLLLMNKARLELVRLHSLDVRELKPLIDAIIADARRSVELLKGRIERDFPLVKKDLESLRRDQENTEDHINNLSKKDDEANKEARRLFHKIEDEEEDLWAALLEIMQKLINISYRKDDFVKKQMRLREQRAHDMALALELLKTQREYYDRLRSCEESLWRWTALSEMYEAYVEAYVPKLLKKVHDAEEADQILYNHEAQEYVRRYEMFEYAVEEGRATRQVYADRLRVLQRSKKLDVERAISTLDPHTEKYNKELQEVQDQLDEAQAYVDLVENIERERRSEVEPILEHVISHNRTLQTQYSEMEATARALRLQEKSTDAMLREVDADAATNANSSPTATTTSVVARGTDGEPTVAEGDPPATYGFAATPPLMEAMRLSTGASGSMMATVAHPHVQARTIGINHEDAFLEKYRRFTDDEQRAVEASAGKVRKVRQNVDKMSIKYDNGDYIKMLLGSNDQDYTASRGGAPVNAP